MKPRLYAFLGSNFHFRPSIHLGFSPSKKHNVSPTAKKIILQLPSKKTQSQKMIKYLNISLKYTRNTAKFLDPKRQLRRWPVGKTLHFRWDKKRCWYSVGRVREIETLRWMYPASLYAKSRDFAAGCFFHFAVDVIRYNYGRVKSRSG